MNEFEKYTKATVLCDRAGCGKRRLPSKMIRVSYPKGKTMSLCSRICADKVWFSFQLDMSLEISSPSSNTGVKTGESSLQGSE